MAMRIRLTKPWKIWSPGHVITDMPPGLAASLIAMKTGEEVVEDMRSQIETGKKKGYVTREMRSA